jgi:hypothetical protein
MNSTVSCATHLTRIVPNATTWRPAVGHISSVPGRRSLTGPAALRIIRPSSRAKQDRGPSGLRHLGHAPVRTGAYHAANGGEEYAVKELKC